MSTHLGHFQLTARLWPALRQASGARVVAVSSRGHRYCPVVFEDPNFYHRVYDPMVASERTAYMGRIAIMTPARRPLYRCFHFALTPVSSPIICSWVS